MPAHYPYGPSSTDRWLTCPGSVPISKQLPPAPESSYAAEGTMCHSAGQKAIEGDGQVKLEDVNGSEELRAAVQRYVDEVTGFRSQHKVIQEWVEHQFVHPKFGDFGGTPDYAAIYEHENLLWLAIKDLKAGAGVAVQAVDNSQLLSYAAIIAANFYLPVDKFHLTIVQPRNYNVEPVQHWETSADVVEAHMVKVYKAMQRVDFKAGPHCRWCPVAPHCEPLHQYNIQISRMSFEDGAITPEKVARWLEIVDMQTVYNDVLKQAEQLLVRAAKQGFDLPKHKVVESRSHRKWVEEDEKVMLRLLADQGINFEQSTSTTIKSPAQLEKVEGLDPELVKSVLKEYATQKLNGYRVVDEDDRGQPIGFGAEFTNAT